jgi:Zn-dependent protease with chaperone function
MIRPVPVTVSYRLSVALAAAAMCAVPLLYAGFVGLTAWLVWLWAHYGLALLLGHVLGLMLYLTGLAAGLTVLFFLGKPFFTKPRLDRGYRVLDMGEHPELAGLIARVCSATGAPEPAEVAVNMQLNGAASLIHPVWGLFNNRYRLILGLPLAAICDRQLMAHVIAHEVGHFSQGGAMRVQQLIHWSQYYLILLIEGRDRWDVWLASQNEGRAPIVRLFAWIASRGVRLSRRVLRLLLTGSSLAHAGMSRQMEFHADLYAIRVAGSAAFAESVVALAAGNAALQKALYISQRSAAENRYPDDLPALVADCYAAIPPDDRRELARQSRYTIGLGHDTHPDDTDRLEQSEREHDPGALAEPGDSGSLFHDFPGLCRAETRAFFSVDNADYIPAADLLREDHARDALDAARIDYFGAVYDGPVWLRLGDPPPVDDAAWREAIDAGDEARSATLSHFQEIAGAYAKWVTATVVLRRLEAELPVDWMRLELEPCDVEEARRRMYAREKEYWARVDTFHETALPVRRRLLAAFARRDRLPADRRARFETLLEEIRALERADEPTSTLAVDLAVLGDLGAQIDANLDSPPFMRCIQAEFEAALRHATQLENALRPEILAYARPEAMPDDSGVYGYLTVYGGVLGRIRDRRLRVMGQLAELALAVEAA